MSDGKKSSMKNNWRLKDIGVQSVTRDSQVLNELKSIITNLYDCKKNSFVDVYYEWVGGSRLINDDRTKDIMKRFNIGPLFERTKNGVINHKKTSLINTIRHVESNPGSIGLVIYNENGDYDPTFIWNHENSLITLKSKLTLHCRKIKMGIFEILGVSHYMLSTIIEVAKSELIDYKKEIFSSKSYVIVKNMRNVLSHMPMSKYHTEYTVWRSSFAIISWVVKIVETKNDNMYENLNSSFKIYHNVDDELSEAITIPRLFIDVYDSNVLINPKNMRISGLLNKEDVTNFPWEIIFDYIENNWKLK